MSNLNEVYHLSEDIFDFFKIHQVRFQKNPFYMELLDMPMLSHSFGTGAEGGGAGEHFSKIEEIITTTEPINNPSTAEVLVNPAMEFSCEPQNNDNFANYPVEVPQTGIENFWL